MNKSIKILIGIIIVIVLIISYIFLKNNGGNFFSVKLTGDFTSSGAQRNYEATLTFHNGALISGEETYYVGQGGGCTSDCERTDSCKILDQNWVNSIDGSECKIDKYIPLSFTEINQKIKNKELKPKSECGHYDVCYEIISS